MQVVPAKNDSPGATLLFYTTIECYIMHQLTERLELKHLCDYD